MHEPLRTITPITLTRLILWKLLILWMSAKVQSLHQVTQLVTHLAEVTTGDGRVATARPVSPRTQNAGTVSPSRRSVLAGGRLAGDSWGHSGSWVTLAVQSYVTQQYRFESLWYD
jgi:hypothetical protein